MVVKIKPLVGPKIEAPVIEEGKLPLRAHLEELRFRLIRSVIAIVVTTGLSLVFAKQIFVLLQSRAGNIPLVYIEMTEMIETYFLVAVTSGAVLALPYITLQVVLFLRPGLTGKERQYLVIFLPSILLSFAAGVVFGFYVLVPAAAEFLVTFGNDIAVPQIRVSNYVSLILRLLFAIGISFETPLFMFFLSKMRILNPDLLKRYRKFAFITAFIIGAVITPTFDPVNQCLVAIPLYILFEAGIILSWIARRGDKKRTA